MENKKNIFSLLYQLWNHIKNSKRIYFFFYILLTLLCAFAEILSLGSIIPFLTVFINPDKLLNYEPISFIINYLNIESSDQLLFPITLFFCATVLFSGLLKYLLLKLNFFILFCLAL